jgi:uncharacterized repeat protein (TIGR03803 family)
MIEAKQIYLPSICAFGVTLLMVIALAPVGMGQSTDSTQSPTFSVLHSFGDPNNGFGPGGLIQDSAGSLYGVTGAGGDQDCDLSSLGCGVVYKLNRAGAETVLHQFNGNQTDEGGPVGRLVRDSNGNLYGVTNGSPLYCGTAYKLDKSGNETVLHVFSCGADGGLPSAGLLHDSSGNLYGTTSFGGAFNFGTVFKIDSSGNETVLHSFTGQADGGLPSTGLVRDSAGNLYGTAGGGASGQGVIFKLDSTGKETVLHTFKRAEGSSPNTTLLRDAAGNLYGTTGNGGDPDCNFTGSAGCGTVFKLSHTGTFSVLYTFEGHADGGVPSADLVLDAAGNLYGATGFGGDLNDCQGSGCGVVFQLNPQDVKTVLHTFTGGTDGGAPDGLLLGTDGNLYGTTAIGGGGHDVGVIFKIGR